MSKSKRRLTTKTVDNVQAVRAFFDELAGSYIEFHGDADRLLRYRVNIIQRLLPLSKRGAFLEIGCGSGTHLFALTKNFDTLIGTDLSPRMIAVCERTRQHHPDGQRIRLTVDSADELSSVDNQSIDVVLCIGALEHMLKKDTVLKQVRRVLKSNGVFICLTPNGEFVWYTALAPWLGFDTQHLSSDEFIIKSQLLDLLKQAGLISVCSGFWRFIPRGDMPSWIGHLLFVMDILGRIPGLSRLRGGLYFKAERLA